MVDLTDTYIENRWIVQPNHANTLETAHGGNVMKWMDEAGAMSAMHFAGASCVTAHVDEVNFERPISVGDVALVRSRVYGAGARGDSERTTDSYTVFVAIDDGEPPAPSCLSRRTARKRSARRR